jgi:hypothetical protein
VRKGAKLKDHVLKAMTEAGPKAGVSVRYWPVWMASDQDQFVDTKTTSEPWQLGHGEWVVKLEGKSGGVAVSHCELLPFKYGQGPLFDSSARR